MAARTRKLKVTDTWRDKIRVGMIINHLRNHILGRIEMSPTQLRAAEILLRKVAPDLQAVEHSGEVQHSYVARTPPVSRNTEEWSKQYGPNQIPKTLQ